MSGLKGNKKMVRRKHLASGLFCNNVPSKQAVWLWALSSACMQSSAFVVPFLPISSSPVCCVQPGTCLDSVNASDLLPPLRGRAENHHCNLISVVSSKLVCSRRETRLIVSADHGFVSAAWMSWCVRYWVGGPLQGKASNIPPQCKSRGNWLILLQNWLVFVFSSFLFSGCHSLELHFLV